MDLALVFRVLRRYIWLLLIGLLVAVLAGLTAGYRVETGKLEPRAERTYSAATTILLSAGELALFEGTKEVPASPDNPTTVIARDLSQSAVIYAYLVSGSEVRAAVENTIGELGTGEEIVGLQRTTQPTGSEQFPGRYNLPILEVVGVAQDPDRAEEISNAAVDAFSSLAAADQEEAGVAPQARVQFEVIRQPEAVEEEGRSPVMLVTVVALGVFLAFVALAFMLYNLSLNRARGRNAEPDDEPETWSADDEQATSQRDRALTAASGSSPSEVSYDDDRETTGVRARR